MSPSEHLAKKGIIDEPVAATADVKEELAREAKTVPDADQAK